jgi:hypothetical protein
MKKILLLIYALIILTPQMAFSEITEMIPCSILTSKTNKIHYEVLRRESRLALPDIKSPVFIMYETPAFKPESILVLYKEEALYKLELLQFDKSLWSQISEQIEKLKNKDYDSKQIKVTYNLSRKSKKLNSETATLLKKAVDLVFKKTQNPTEEESKSGKTYLDGTVYTFESTNGSCGIILGHFEGNAKRFLDIALLLKQYLTSDELSQTDIENQIINLSSGFKNIL